jgi:hypothetical protein
MSAETYQPPAYQSKDQNPNPVIGFFWALLFLGALFVAGPFAQFHAVYLGCAGLLMLIYPPQVSLPRVWWVLAGLFVLAGSAQFLPASWFTKPEWRSGLEGLGVATGTKVTIQVRQAVETYTLFVAMLFTGLWLAGQRSSGAQLRFWTLIFATGVALYAVLAWILQHSKGMGAVYGFFPNRNHTATLLAMGSICGLGSVIQAMREKRYPAMGVALVVTSICLWALGAWSVSRAGILLFSVGALIWLSMLGKRYLGGHALKVLGLIGLLGIGLFFIADSNVKNRIIETTDRARFSESDARTAPTVGGQSSKREAYLDFRVPIAKDTLNMISDFKWTGVGAGQFRSIFPQYRNLSAVVNDSQSYHPESDWLWMASEVGVIGTGALAVLVILAFWKARGKILSGRDRALRSACMVAALLVPLHGIFDVPGHRIVLAWSAAFLFCLSLSSAKDERKPGAKNPRIWPFRMGGAVLVLLAVYLILASMKGGVKLALDSSSVAIGEAKALYEKDLALQNAAYEKGRDYQPTAEDDLIEKAIRILEEAKSTSPLDPTLWRFQVQLAMYFDDRNDWIDHQTKVEQALDPTWVQSPLLLAESWSTVSADRSFSLFQEALRRADHLDRIVPDMMNFRKDTLVSIKRIAGGKPELESKILGLK